MSSIIGAHHTSFTVADIDVSVAFFRDRLGCADALYLDGTISRLWAPGLGRDDGGGAFQGILAVTKMAPTGRGARSQP